MLLWYSGVVEKEKKETTMITSTDPTSASTQEERLYSLDAEMVIDGVLTSICVCTETLPEIAEWVKYGPSSIRKWTPPADIEDYKGEYTREGVATYARRALDGRYRNIEVYEVMTHEEQQELWAEVKEKKFSSTKHNEE